MKYTPKHRKVLSFIAIIVGLIWVAGCENTFDPTADKEAYFSMFGAFDLSKERQWVRVMPIKDSLVYNRPRQVDAQVFLIRHSNNEEVQLNSPAEDSWHGQENWDYWTDESLAEGEKYTLRAIGSNGETSSATFTMPYNFPTPKVEYFQSSESGRIFGEAPDSIVVADGIYDVSIIFRSNFERYFNVPISHLGEIEFDGSGNFEVTISDRDDLAEKYGVSQRNVSIEDREALIVGGTQDWPDVTGLSLEELAIPNINSNVENGVGVVLGIVSKRIPLRSCYDENNELTGCPLIN